MGFSVIGIDIIDFVEIGQELISQIPYFGGLGGIYWKLSKDKKKDREHIIKDFQEKHLKARELDKIEADRAERFRRDKEVRVSCFGADLAMYIDKEMGSIKDTAWNFCLDNVNNLISQGYTEVDKIVDDELFKISLTDNAMTKFKFALGDSFFESKEEMSHFMDFEAISSYDEIAYCNAVREKIEDVSRVWMNTLKATGMVEVYRVSIEQALAEKVCRSVERIYNRCLSKSDNMNVNNIIDHYRTNFFTPVSLSESIEPVGESIEREPEWEQPMVDNPFIGS